MKQIHFVPADILLPKTDFERWAVVACDQYTSEPDYWRSVERTVGEAPSAYRLILPEAFLDDRPDERIRKINATMYAYLEKGVFEEYKNTFLYTERTQRDGRVLPGLVGAIDLDAYDYRPGARTPVRATEGTVLERIPPRVAIRRDAPLELPHILLLIDDPIGTVIEPLAARRNTMRKVYDFDLMQDGGHAAGYIVPAPEAITDALSALFADCENPLWFAIGDGNHSLAAAKACREQNPTPLNRYALVEVVNIHADALDFEPIYRVLYGADYADLMRQARAFFAPDPTGQKIAVLHGDTSEVLQVAPQSTLPVGTLQCFLDEYLKGRDHVRIDYVHGEDTARRLAEQGAVAFLFDGMQKDQLFPAILADGALPRKTFSMGLAHDKRYYIEARKIK